MTPQMKSRGHPRNHGVHVAGTATGRPVDGRNDFFGLGTILYEMLAGNRAFRNETDIGTI